MPSLKDDSSLKLGLFLKSSKLFVKVTLLRVFYLFLLFQVTVLVSGAQSYAFSGIMVADLDDVESEMEDTLQESDAAAEEAKASRNRADSERRAADRAKEEAQGAIARARSKSRDAEAQISEHDKKIIAVKQEKEVYQKDIQRSEV